MKKCTTSLVIAFILFFQYSYSQWESTGGPHGKVNITDLHYHDSTLFAATESGVYARHLSDDEWQQVTYYATQRILSYGDTVYISSINTLGLIYKTSTGYGSFYYPFMGSPYMNRPTFESLDSMFVLGDRSGFHIAPYRNDSTFLYNNGIEADTIVSGANVNYEIRAFDVCVSPDHVYGLANTGLYRSKYDLSGWTKVSGELNGYKVGGLYFAKNRLFAATSDSLFVSQDSGASWSYVFSDGAFVNNIIDDGSSLYLSTSNRIIYQSSDNGISWNIANQGIPDEIIRGLYFYHGELYSSVFGEGLLYYDNNQWEQAKVKGLLNTDLHAIEATWDGVFTCDFMNGVHKLDSGEWVNISPIDTGSYIYHAFAKVNDTIATLVEQYREGKPDTVILCYSGDAGASWEMSSNPFDDGNVRFANSSMRYINGKIYLFSDDELYVSSGFKQSWVDISPKGLTCAEINDITYFDGDLYMGVCSSNVLYTYSHSANNWVRVGSGNFTSKPIGRFAVRDTALFVMAEDQTYRRYKTNNIWQRADNGDSPYYMSDFLNVGPVLFAVSWNGVTLTSDYGQNWIGFNDSLNLYTGPSDITLFQDTLYLATRFNGVYKNALPASLVSLIENKVEVQPLSIYPNPAQNSIEVSTENIQLGEYEIISLDGQVLSSGAFKSDQKIELPQLAEGLYHLAVFNDHYMAIGKLLIQK